MSRPLNYIIAHIRAACENPSIKTTLIQTEDLLALCQAVESPGGMALGSTTTPSAFALDCLAVKEGWEHQPFQYYAAHFLVGAGLVGGNLDGNIRALTAAIKKQYDIGVEHGMKNSEAAPA